MSHDDSAPPDKLHDFSNDAITVTWSKRRCIHAAECVRGLPDVFAPGERPWVRPEQADGSAIAQVVERCPTGALHHQRHDGGAPEATPDTNAIRVTRNGPLHVRGDVELIAPDGRLIVRDTRVALCRCGASANKPFCDNRHLQVRFEDRGEVFEGGVRAVTEDASRALRIEASRNGPLKLSGPLTVVSADGRVILEGGGASLCRCGQSRNKPFCDGSHTTAGFVSE